jgi:hypothetical protein
VTEHDQTVTCDVVGCNQSATGRYLDVRPEAAVEFCVCANHFTRIEAGESVQAVAERFDLAELDGRLVLVMNPP